MEKSMIKMAVNDTVATALENIQKGDKVQIYELDQTPAGMLVALSDIPYGNKIALVDVEKGTSVVKYGEVMGVALSDIPCGKLVHVHNVGSLHLDIPANIIEDIIREMKIEA